MFCYVDCAFVHFFVSIASGVRAFVLFEVYVHVHLLYTSKYCLAVGAGSWFLSPGTAVEEIHYRM